jgi:hypothetical protein
VRRGLTLLFLLALAACSSKQTIANSNRAGKANESATQASDT